MTMTINYCNGVAEFIWEMRAYKLMYECGVRCVFFFLLFSLYSLGIGFLYTFRCFRLLHAV